MSRFLLCTALFAIIIIQAFHGTSKFGAEAASSKSRKIKTREQPDDYYEHRYKEYQRSLPSPNDGKQLVPYEKDAEEVDFIRSLSVGKLRRYLKDREASCPGCVEKFHLIERALQVRGWETDNDRVANSLTAAQFSAENAMSFHHLQEGIPVDASGNPVVTTTSYKKQMEAIQLTHGIHCTEALYNGTQYCHQVPVGDASSW